MKFEEIYNKLCKDEIFPNDADWKEWLEDNDFSESNNATIILLNSMKQVLKDELKDITDQCPDYDADDCENVLLKIKDDWYDWADHAYEIAN